MCGPLYCRAFAIFQAILVACFVPINNLNFNTIKTLLVELSTCQNIFRWAGKVQLLTWYKNIKNDFLKQKINLFNLCFWKPSPIPDQKCNKNPTHGTAQYKYTNYPHNAKLYLQLFDDSPLCDLAPRMDILFSPFHSTDFHSLPITHTKSLLVTTLYIKET